MRIDLRKLNEITIRDSYPIPLTIVIFNKTPGHKYYSKLELKSAYFQIRIRPGDEYKITFVCSLGHFEFRIMPFGFKNAPACFQRMIDLALSDYLGKFCYAYIDDIIIFSDDLFEHYLHVKKVLLQLRKFHLHVNLEKCEFDKFKVKFLGYYVSSESLKMDIKKVSAILDLSIPTTVKEVQSFLGLANFYRRLIKNFAKIAYSLNKLKRKNNTFVWSKDANDSFELLKRSFTSAPIFIPADPNSQFFVETDASNFALGCILFQVSSKIIVKKTPK